MMKKQTLLILISVLALSLVGCNSTDGNQNSGGDSSDGGSDNPPIHEHTWGTPTYVWADDFSSCIAERVCTEDSTHKETEIKESVHTITPAGCESEGQELYTVTFDNSAFETQTHSVRLSPTGHNWGTPTYEWNANYSQCTATRICLNDSTHIETETVNSTYVGETKCIEEVIRTYTATFTNDAFITQTHNEPLSPTGHNWGAPTYEWNANYSQCTATRICLNDSTHIETETVNSTSSVLVEPTESKEGLERYIATFANSIYETQIIDIALEKLEEKYYGETPRLLDGDTKITYGFYPQTNVNNSKIVSELNKLTTPDEHGYYEYNNQYYAKVIVQTERDSLFDNYFDNGDKITAGTHWFKCEPIVWTIRQSANNQYQLVSEKIIEHHVFNKENGIITVDGKSVVASDYAYSEVRSWLIDEFYNTAFIFGDSHIQTTIIDNTTDSYDSSFSCENTEDKISLLSYSDLIYLNGRKVYSECTSRRKTTTDYVRAKYSTFFYSTDYHHTDHYLTRSPSSYGSSFNKKDYRVWDVWFDGSLSYASHKGCPPDVHNGIAPCIWIEMPSE